MNSLMQSSADLPQQSRSYIRSLLQLQLETKLATVIREMMELGVQDMQQVTDADTFCHSVVAVCCSSFIFYGAENRKKEREFYLLCLFVICVHRFSVLQVICIALVLC